MANAVARRDGAPPGVSSRGVRNFIFDRSSRERRGGALPLEVASFDARCIDLKLAPRRAMLCFASQRVFDRFTDHGAITRLEERDMREIKLGVGSNLLLAATAGVAVALAFVLLGGTALGYAVVAAVIVAAILYFIFEAIV
jgi:hypothetical protein